MGAKQLIAPHDRYRQNIATITTGINGRRLKVYRILFNARGQQRF
jgi:hypothetical protein